MNIVKSIVKVVWPIIYNVLQKAADRTDTQLDDIAVEAANTAVHEWLNDTQLDVNFIEHGFKE
jgi:hypothetical protein